jgi:kinesin family protein 2/24
MYDKRTLRVKRRDVFERAISNFAPATTNQSLEDAGVSVYVRKRPLFEKEQGDGEFDAITVHGKSLVVAHTASFQADLRTPFMTHHHWPFDHVFDENASNGAVYEEVVTPLMEIFRQDRPATVFMYGQTGSGKTFTIRAIMESLVEDIFQYAEFVDVECFEIAGKKVVDLPSRTELQLREVKQGKHSVLHVGAARERVSSGKALLAHMLAAQRRRATQKTQANSGSSRSHFCVRIYCVDGVPFTLVDLAGTERRKDSDAHSKERAMEGAEINSSLHALKECIRAQGKQWAPYRNSPLTRVLQESLANSGHAAKLAVIATVSPSGTDIEHSLSTLQVAYMLSGRSNELVHVATTDASQMVAPPQRILHPTKFSHEEIVDWIYSLGNNFSYAADSLPQSVDGKGLSRWNVQCFVQHCDDAKLGEALASAWMDLLKKAADVQKRERAKRKG